MARSLVMASKNAQSSSLPIRYGARLSKTSLGTDSAQQRNFLYVLWEIKAPERHAHNFVELIGSIVVHQSTTPIFVNQSSIGDKERNCQGERASAIVHNASARAGNYGEASS